MLLLFSFVIEIKSGDAVDMIRDETMLVALEYNV